MQPLAWAALVSGAGCSDACLLQQLLALKITLHVRRRHCAHFILEGERRTSSSHCSCSLSCSRLFQDASLSLSTAFSLCGSLCWLSISAALSLSALFLCQLSLRFSRLLFLALCASFSKGPSPSTVHWRSRQNATTTNGRSYIRNWWGSGLTSLFVDFQCKG